MSAPLELQNVKVPIKSDGRLYHEKMFSFDATGEFDVPTVMTKADNSLCWIASTRNVSGVNKLTISRSPSGYFLLGGSANGRDLISGSGVSGSAICASRYDAVTTEPPVMNVSCSNMVGKKCHDSKSGDPITDITAEVTINTMLQNCLGCSAKFTKVSGDFELSSAGNTATVSTTRSGINPGTNSKSGQVRIDLVAENGHVIVSTVKNIELHATINEPTLTAACNPSNCTSSASTQYGVTASSGVKLRASYSNCTSCKVKYTVVSGNLSTDSKLEMGSSERSFNVSRDKHSSGTETKSGKVRVDLIADGSGAVLKSVEKTINASATVGTPDLSVSCNPGSCSSSVTTNYGTTAYAKASVSASFSNCTGCSIRITKVSGSDLKGSGNSRYVDVSRAGTSSGGPSRNSSKARIQLINSSGHVVKTIDKDLSVAATIKGKPAPKPRTVCYFDVNAYMWANGHLVDDSGKVTGLFSGGSFDNEYAEGMDLLDKPNLPPTSTKYWRGKARAIAYSECGRTTSINHNYKGPSSKFKYRGLSNHVLKWNNNGSSFCLSGPHTVAYEICRTEYH